MPSNQDTIIPEETVVVSEIKRIQAEEPEFGAKRIALKLREGHPEWTLNDKRVLKLMRNNNLTRGFLAKSTTALVEDNQVSHDEKAPVEPSSNQDDHDLPPVKIESIANVTESTPELPEQAKPNLDQVLETVPATEQVGAATASDVESKLPTTKVEATKAAIVNKAAEVKDQTVTKIKEINPTVGEKVEQKLESILPNTSVKSVVESDNKDVAAVADSTKEASTSKIDAAKDAALTKATEIKDQAVSKVKEVNPTVGKKVEEKLESILPTKQATSSLEGQKEEASAQKDAATSKVEAAKDAVLNKAAEVKDQAVAKIKDVNPTVGTTVEEKLDGVLPAASSTKKATAAVDSKKGEVVGAAQDALNKATAAIDAPISYDKPPVRRNENPVGQTTMDPQSESGSMCSCAIM